MFIIPVVPPSSISSLSFVDAFFFLKDTSSGLTTTLYMIFCYKFYYDFFLTCKLYVKFALIHLYIFSYMKMIFDIYFLHIWQFFSMSRWIFFYKCIFSTFLNHLSWPDVASVIVPLVHVVSVVVSVSVTVSDCDVHNTVGFVFIFVSGVCAHTLLWYSTPNYMLLSFYIISTYHMYFYILM